MFFKRRDCKKGVALSARAENCSYVFTDAHSIPAAAPDLSDIAAAWTVTQAENVDVCILGEPLTDIPCKKPPKCATEIQASLLAMKTKKADWRIPGRAEK